jgi:hypothetical protein
MSEIRSRVNTKEFDENYDRIFKTPTQLELFDPCDDCRKDCCPEERCFAGMDYVEVKGTK